jgi:two-component sensor histidine kinase
LSKSPKKSSPPGDRRLDGTREIHHRVKNNLQIIASILRLQMRREDSVSAQTALGGAITRIMGMVQVHDLLSQKDARKVDLRELLERLLDLNVQAFMMPGQTIRPKTSGPSVIVDADKAVALALAANELIVNALKHAFRGRREGTIEARVEARGKDVAVRVEDDGVGLPEGFTLTGSPNLGLRLVQSVARDDLKGQFELARAARGTSAVVRFRR